MPEVVNLEERMTKVEKELSELRSQFDRSGTKRNWIKMVEGTFEDRPEFEEVLRLGKELRDAEQEQYPE